jgi:hypothetical protein
VRDVRCCIEHGNTYYVDEEVDVLLIKLLTFA